MSGRTYQARVQEWTTACFPPSAQGDVSERAHRFLEEAIELAQASNCSRDEALALVDLRFLSSGGRGIPGNRRRSSNACRSLQCQ